jgi:hypothetical protein
MRITVEEQQKRSERARLGAYARRKSRKKRQKHKQAGFKTMRLIKKSMWAEGKAAIRRFLSSRPSRKKVFPKVSPKRT